MAAHLASVVVDAKGVWRALGGAEARLPRQPLADRVRQVLNTGFRVLGFRHTGKRSRVAWVAPCS